MTTTRGRTRELITPMMRNLVNGLDPTLRTIVSYHLGWCDEQGYVRDHCGGKAIRPAIALLAAEASGAAPRCGVAGAVAIELVHNFSLVHDDLMDRDATRRHRRTVWAVWGDAMAILAGDAMLSLAHQALLDYGQPETTAAQRILTVATRQLISGQAADVDFESRHDVTLGECIDMARGKTASLMAASAEIGAALGGAPPSVRDALRTFGGHLGLAFQLADDLLGIWGQPAITGKPVYSDLRSCKKTLPITWTLEHGGQIGTELACWMTDRDNAARASDDELRAIAGLVERGGGRAWATQEARRCAGLAAAAVARTDIAGEPASELRGLVRELIDREV
ncbi:MAG TPA: polyprenyl synthetase family protein [Mycobacterium sp.]|nr:polyprenyl synthetase family protein [Mycobacterium sp.]